MSALWIEIATSPPMAFYRGERPASAPTYAQPGLLSGGTIRAPLNFNGGGETTNTTASLDNGDAGLTALFTNPGLLVAAAVKYQATAGASVQTLISGQVDSVSVSRVIDVGIVG